MTAENAFAPFWVVGGRDGKNIFRVTELPDDIKREQIERILRALPISFELRRNLENNSEILREPLEVLMRASVLYVYPPNGRVIACTTFDSWGSEHVVRQMHVDNVMDMTFPGYGQIRTCVHFDPSILGIRDWPERVQSVELELDIHVFPRVVTEAPKIEPLVFDKFKLRDLLDTIMGADKPFTAMALSQWREIVMYAVATMRAMYESPHVSEDYPLSAYYADCWQRIDFASASRDDEELASAIEYLRDSIKVE
ncbi:hypothetical protein L0Y46_03660 [bacterium]|nr:hypothetical protein [bacterium]